MQIRTNYSKDEIKKLKEVKTTVYFFGLIVIHKELYK